MGLPVEELIGVMVHEVGHIALRHLARRQGRDPLKWNIAADFAVNDIILNTVDDSGCRIFQLPTGVLFNPAWHDQTAEWIYNKLPEIKRKRHWTTMGSGATAIKKVGQPRRNGKTASPKQRWMPGRAVSYRGNGRRSSMISYSPNWNGGASYWIRWSVMPAMTTGCFPPTRSISGGGSTCRRMRGEEINIAMYIDVLGVDN